MYVDIYTNQYIDMHIGIYRHIYTLVGLYFISTSTYNTLKTLSWLKISFRRFIKPKSNLKNRKHIQSVKRSHMSRPF